MSCPSFPKFDSPSTQFCQHQHRAQFKVAGAQASAVFFRAQVPARALPRLGSCGGPMGDPEKWTVLAESAAYLLSAVFLSS